MQRLVWLPDGDHVLAISSAFEDAVVAVWEIPSRPWQASLLQETSLSASSTEALADTATLTVSPSGDTFLVRATTNRDAREYGTAFEDVR
jgi:L-aminopeptidase/D-esterase-like protein